MIDFKRLGLLAMPLAEVDSIQARFAMSFERNALRVVSPDFIMPKFEFEPLTEDDLKQSYIGTDWGRRPLPNISKLRSTIRKQKQNAIKARRK
jgi:hypothetical protein